MAVLGRDERVSEDPNKVVATPKGFTLRFESVEKPGIMIATGEQPALPEFKPRESTTGATYLKSITK